MEKKVVQNGNRKPSIQFKSKKLLKTSETFSKGGLHVLKNNWQLKNQMFCLVYNPVILPILIFIKKNGGKYFHIFNVA